MATQEMTMPRSSAQERPGYSRPLAIVTTLFFMWGFLTSLNDILIPHLKSVFDLSYTRAMLVQFAFFSAYFLFSIPWSKAVNIIGYQRTMVAGLITMAAGAFLFIPAASAASYPLFLTALMILAGGITGLQVAANPYVVVLGNPQTASSRLDLTQAFNSLGTTIGPKIGGLLILSAAPVALSRVEQASSVKLPYLAIGFALVFLAVLIGFSKLPRIETAPSSRSTDSIWRHPNLYLAAIGIFAYVGAEVAIGSFLVSYFGLPEITNLSAKTAAGYVSFYWGGAMIGRFLGAGVLRRVKAGHLLAICAGSAAGLVVISMLIGGPAAMWTILAVGFFNSIMFPTIFSLGEAELGPLTGNASGLLNMAIVGGAIIPLMVGVTADSYGLHQAFILPVVCYLYIVYYGIRGSRPNSERYA